MRVRLVTDVHAIDQLRAGWQVLERAPTDHGAPFFQSYAWCRHVARLRLASSPRRFRVLIATVYDGDDLIGLWPLSLHRQTGLWVARALDYPFGQLGGFLCRHAEFIEPAMRAVLVAIRRARGADALGIDGVIEGSPLHCALISTGATTVGSNDIVQVDMRGHATFQDYQLTLNTKTRKNLRNAMNRLTRLGGVDHRVVREGAELVALVGTTFDGRLEWLRHHGKSATAFRDPDFRLLVDGVCEAAGLDQLGFALDLDGKRIASQWGFVHNDRYYAYISTRDEAFDQYSPGRLHLGLVIEACKKQGLDVLELMAPATRYKLMWSDRVTNVHDLWLPLTARATVTMGVLDTLTPAARSIVRALPLRLRSRLADKVNGT